MLTLLLVLLANASGAVKLKTVALITPEEVDEAVKKTMDWRPPGKWNNDVP